MGSKPLGALMKSLFLKFRKTIFRPGFFQGAVVSISFTSLVSIAATNLPGFFIFSTGTPISSSEVNSNFEKLAGSILLKAVITDNISLNTSNFSTPTTCPTCNIYSKKLMLSSISVGVSNVSQSTDTDVDSASKDSFFNYISIPSDGWYEFRLISHTISSLSGTTCSIAGCNANVNANTNINLANSLVNAQGHPPGTSVAWVSSFDNLNDIDSDAIFDLVSNNYATQPPEIKKYYLKAGQILYFSFNASYSQNNSTVQLSVTNSSMDITIIKL